ncbi:MAG: hypothetical protein AAGJ80_18200, partial [Cyanobacteria bacterium J06553_1]
MDWDTALGRNRVQLFATLTVHRDRGVAHARAALEKLRKRLYRCLPSLLSAWKLEPQKRGAPHYHLVLVVDLEELAGVVGVRPRTIEEACECPLELMRGRLKTWLLNAWREVTAQPSITQVDLQEARTRGGVRRYMSKYMAKGHSVPEHWVSNRYWGFWGEWPERTEVAHL